MKLGLGVVLVVAVIACAPDWDGLDPSLASGEGGAGGEEVEPCAGAPADSVVDVQTVGDCQVLRCDGLGNAFSASDPQDLPASEECREGVCKDGEPGLVAKPYGTPCHDSRRICDGKGACVKCWWDCKD